MPLETLELDVQALICEASNLRKSINKKFKLETLKSKLLETEKLFKEVDNILLTEENKLSDVKFNFYAKASRNAFNEISTIIKNKIKTMPETSQAVAAAVLFDEKRASSIIQIYDGAAEKLEDFIFAVEYINKRTPASQKADLLEFLQLRVTGTARKSVPRNIESIELMLQKLKEKCGATDTPKTLQTKLNALKQTDSLDSFCRDLAQAAQDLENCYLGRAIPANEASQLTLDSAIDASVNGLKNKDLKQILRAGRFQSVKELTDKILSNKDLEKVDQTAGVLHVQQQHRQQHNNRGNGQFRGNRRGNFRGNWRGNHSNQNFQQPQQNRPNFRQNNYQNRGRGGNFNNFRNFQQQQHRNFQPRIFYASSQPQQQQYVLPQQHQYLFPQQQVRQNDNVQPNFLGETRQQNQQGHLNQFLQ